MLRTLNKTDAEIQQDVIREMKWDTRVDEADVGVAVEAGVVTLAGTVPNYLAREAAQEAAHEVAGVRDVVNNIQVRTPGSGTRTDADIAHSVRRVLEWHPRIPHERIQTTVSNGWVTLEGELDRWAQRSEAERAVSRLSGVHGVINFLEVRAPEVAAVEIRESIEEALERRAEREAERIQVLVHDGVVTLGGRVRTWSERRAIVGAAGHAPGVKKLVDNLRIDPFL